MSEQLQSPRRIVNKGRKSLCGWHEIWDDPKKKCPVKKTTSWKHPRDLGIVPSEFTPEYESPGTPRTPIAPGTPVTDSDDEFVVKKVSSFTKKEESGKKIVKFGFISKLGEVFKTWKSRYFVLFDDGNLEYYANVKAPKVVGEYADLTVGQYKGGMNVGFSRFRNAKGIKKGDLVLEIELNQRHFVLSFETKEEYLSWKKAFESQGCDWYDLLVPSQKTVLEHKMMQRKLSLSKIKREEKGRAYEMAIEEQRIEKMATKQSKSFHRGRVMSTATQDLYVDVEEPGLVDQFVEDPSDGEPEWVDGKVEDY